MKPQEAIEKGQAALELMQNPTYILAIDTVRLGAFRDIANSLPEEVQKRENAYQLLRATDLLKGNLEALVTNAKFEEAKIRTEQTQKEKDD